MEFNNLLKIIGEFGIYQRLLCALLCLVSVPSAFQAMGFVFWAAVPDYWCATQTEEANLTNSQKSQCEIYQLNSSHVNNGSMMSYFADGSIYQNVTIGDGLILSRKCDHWRYDRSVYKSTIVTEVSKNHIKASTDRRLTALCLSVEASIKARVLTVDISQKMIM